MIPIVATLLGTLAENGLGLLSSAIQAKGKEMVENTLGVKIPDAPTPEDVAKLRQLQYDHEERQRRMRTTMCPTAGGPTWAPIRGSRRTFGP